MSSFKFHNLAGSPNKSCNLISFRDTLIMMDCALEFMSTLGYLPLPLIHSHQLSALPNWSPSRDQLKAANFNYKESRMINFEVKECHSGFHCVDATPEFACFDANKLEVDKIDVVLISNYLNMFALPYLTERFNFNGIIYVTEPTYHFGRIMMEEIVKLIERCPRPRKVQLWKRIYEQLNLSIPRNHVMNMDPNSWLTIYTRDELNSCLSKLKVINFAQTIDVFGLFEVSAHSSGFCMGSCNWTLKSNHEKIVYMSQTSLLTTHPKPFESQPLRDADVMVLTNLTPSPLINPDTMLGDFCSHTIQALKNDGNVLIPCYPCGTVYDLIECIAGKLTAANLQQVPIYFLSPVAEASLAYSNILGEWLTASKQCRVFTPDEPFIHSSLVRARKLMPFSSVSDPNFNGSFKCPCVVFTGHPSLRFGDVVHFIQLWGQSSKNLLILTEPDFPCQEAVNPYLPLAMRILYLPIDTNWNFKQANALLSNDLRPRNLIVHNSYVTKPSSDFYSAHGFAVSDLMIDLQQSNAEIENGTSETAIAKTQPKTTAIHSYGYKNVIDLPEMKTVYERVQIDQNFASKIIQSEIRPGVSLATVSGTLVARDNKYTLLSIDNFPSCGGPARSSNLPPSSHYFGNLDFQMLMDLLAQSGVTDATVDGAKTGKIIELKSLRAILHLEDHQTHIIAADHHNRMKLRELVTACLKKF